MATETEFITTMIIIFSFVIGIGIYTYFSDEEEKKELIKQRIALDKIRVEEQRIERLLEIEKDALEEWMINNNDASDDVSDESTTTFTFEEKTTFEDVRTNYPKLTEKYEAGWLESAGLDSSVDFDQGNGLMMYISIITVVIHRLKSLKFAYTYTMISKHPDGKEVFTVSADTPEEEPKKRSRRITQKVKDNVWNRDGGRCVECDSNENLEFDHIIPHSKGGANTYRNIQLLCQDCNRTKSAKIG